MPETRPFTTPYHIYHWENAHRRYLLGPKLDVYLGPIGGPVSDEAIDALITRLNAQHDEIARLRAFIDTRHSLASRDQVSVKPGLYAINPPINP